MSVRVGTHLGHGSFVSSRVPLWLLPLALIAVLLWGAALVLYVTVRGLIALVRVLVQLWLRRRRERARHDQK